MTTDLRLIEAFVSVVRQGSLTKAEAVSGVPKGTLSKQIARLEADLGMQLLTRGARRVTPTEAGRAFFMHSVALLDEVTGRLEAARTFLQNINEGVTGSLSLLSDIHFGTTFVCHVVRLFLDNHPNVQCELDVVGDVGAPSVDDVDCYVCSAPPDHPNLVAKLLGRLSYSIYASPRYLSREPAPESPQDLERHRTIVMRGESQKEPLQLHGANGSCPYTPSPALSTNDYWIMKTFCLDGFGLALMPDFFVRPEVSRGLLVPVLPAWKPAPRRIYCVYQRQRYMGKKVRAFVDLMVSCVANIDMFNIYVAAPEPQLSGMWQPANKR